MNKQILQKLEKIETTIGDLVATITEIALEAGKTEREGYELASLTIESIMRRSEDQSDDTLVT